MSELVKENYKVLFVEPFYIYIDWGTNTENYHSAKNNLDDIQKYIQTSNPEKLKVQTQKLLEKFPNTSKIVFEYQDNKNTNKHTSKKIKPKKK